VKAGSLLTGMDFMPFPDRRREIVRPSSSEACGKFLQPVSERSITLNAPGVLLLLRLSIMLFRRFQEFGNQVESLH